MCRSPWKTAPRGLRGETCRRAAACSHTGRPRLPWKAGGSHRTASRVSPGWGLAPRIARASPRPLWKVELNRPGGIPRTPSSRFGFPCTTNVSRNAALGPTNRAAFCFLHETSRPIIGHRSSDVTSQQFHARAWPEPVWTRPFLPSLLLQETFRGPLGLARASLETLAESDAEILTQGHGMDQTLDRRAGEFHGVSRRDKIKPGPPFSWRSNYRCLDIPAA